MALGGKFFIGGDGAFRAFTPDGVALEHEVVKDDSAERAIQAVYGKGILLALYGQGRDRRNFYRTTDGIEWTQAEAEFENWVQSIAFYDGKFLACAGKVINRRHHPALVHSFDGIKWSKPQKTPGTSVFRQYAAGNDRLVAIGDAGEVSVSRDGIEWELAPDPDPRNTLLSIEFANGVFVGGGMHGLRLRSEDGLTWTHRVEGNEGEHINNMLFVGDRFHGIGLGGTYWSRDGVEWEYARNENAPLQADAGTDRFLGAHWRGRILQSRDALAWKEIAKLPQHVAVVKFIPGNMRSL